MQSSGVLISGALDLSSLLQRPSRSRLNLEINALVVETTRSKFVSIKRSGIYRIQNLSASSNEKVIKFFRYNVFVRNVAAINLDGFNFVTVLLSFDCHFKGTVSQ
jgi:hypothetical protein